MKIGLMRHFKVAQLSPKYCSSTEYDKSISDYDSAAVIPKEVEIQVDDYHICFASSMKRAMDTARFVFKKEIIISDDLVEIPLRSIFKTNLKLPFKLWNIINRMGWVFNVKNVPESKRQSHERAFRFLSNLLTSNHENHNILIVSHGLFMVTLQIELSRMGFKGDDFFRAEYGRLYEFQRYPKL